MLADSGRLDAVALDALAADELVSGLLLVHGLHPYDVTTRVARALDSVRPYLGSSRGGRRAVGDRRCRGGHAAVPRQLRRLPLLDA